MGAIDGTHIRILTPCLNPNDYFCYKKSVVLLAIAGPIFECLWFHVGCPGKASDSKIYCETGVKEFVETLKHDEHLIGDSACPRTVLKVNDDIDDDEADSDTVAPTSTGTAKRDFLRDQLWRKRNA